MGLVSWPCVEVACVSLLNVGMLRLLVCVCVFVGGGGVCVCRGGGG
jgi:hypothetical protein